MYVVGVKGGVDVSNVMVMYVYICRCVRVFACACVCMCVRVCICVRNGDIDTKIPFVLQNIIGLGMLAVQCCPWSLLILIANDSR